MHPARVVLSVLVLGPLLCGASCGGQKVEAPDVVEVPVDRVVPVPENLTRDCYDEEPREQTPLEAVRLAKVRRESLAECTARMRQIRALKRPES